MDTHRPSAPTTFARPSAAATADTDSAPGGDALATLRPEVDADASKALLADRRLLTVGITLLPLVVVLSTTRLSTAWQATAVALTVLVAGLVVRARIRRHGRVSAAIDAGGPTTVLLATCVADRAGWRLDLTGTDEPGRVVASVRRPVLGDAMSRFLDQEVSRTRSPESLRRAPWRAWRSRPVLVVGGPSARAVTALRAADGGPWVLSTSRHGSAPRPAAARRAPSGGTA